MVNPSEILSFLTLAVIIQVGVGFDVDSDSSSSSTSSSNRRRYSPQNNHGVCLVSCYCENDHDSVCALTLETGSSPQQQQQQQQHSSHDSSSGEQNKQRNSPGKKPSGSSKHMGAAAAAGAAAVAGAAAAGAVAAYHGQQQQQQESWKPKTFQKKPSFQNNNYQSDQQQAGGVKHNYKCNWCMRSNCKPGACQAVRNFNAQEDAEKLKDAVSGWKTKENVLIDILLHRSEEQLELIRQAYQGFGKSLDKDIKDNTKFKLMDLFEALLQYREDFFAQELKRAFKSKDDNAVIMMLTSVSPCAVKEIGSAYYRNYKTPLIDDAKDASSWNYEEFLVELIKGNRDEDGPVDYNRAREDAQALYKAGPDTWFKEESVFIDVFTHRSYSHIRQVQEEYNKLRPKIGLKKDIERNTSGSLTKGLLVMLNNIENQPQYFGDEIEGAARPIMGNNIKDNKALIRILRGRCGIDLGDIRDAYPLDHDNKPLAKMLKDQAFGDYKKAVVEMCTEQEL